MSATKTYGPATAYYAAAGGLVVVNSVVLFPRYGFGAAVGVWLVLLAAWLVKLKDGQLPWMPSLSIDKSVLQQFRENAPALYPEGKWTELQAETDCIQQCKLKQDIVNEYQKALRTLNNKQLEVKVGGTPEQKTMNQWAENLINIRNKGGLTAEDDQKQWRTLMSVIYEYNEYARIGALEGRAKVHDHRSWWDGLKHKVFSIPDEDGAVAYRNLTIIFLVLSLIVLAGSKPGPILYVGLGLMVVFCVLYGKHRYRDGGEKRKAVKALRQQLKETLEGADLKHVIAPESWENGGVGRAYRKTSPLWVNGAWLNYWRLVIVATAFHFIALRMSAHTHVPDFAPSCHQTSSPSTFSPKELSNADQCATYMVLEQLNMLGSLVCTFILFALLLAGGYVMPPLGEAGKPARKVCESLGKFCRDTIGTEDVRIPGEWWNIVAHGQTWRALGLYILVFAFVGHLSAVGYVYKNQGGLLRDASVHRSFAFTGMAPGAAPPPSTAAEQQQTIIQYAMYNDLFNNFIMIVLLLFVVPYVKAKFSSEK